MRRRTELNIQELLWSSRQRIDEIPWKRRRYGDNVDFKDRPPKNSEEQRSVERHHVEQYPGRFDEEAMYVNIWRPQGVRYQENRQ